jgi:hypothetical protein
MIGLINAPVQGVRFFRPSDDEDPVPSQMN